MTPHYQDDTATLYAGDCLEVLRGLPDASVDSVVTDPPYGLEFMGKEWDGANGFRRSLNPADADRDNAFGRTSRTSPEYRAGTVFQQWCELWATECLRVLKPGGHLLAFGGTRTSHRLACAIEDAGFEIRDSIAWMYGSGFPKSLAVGRAIDRQMCAAAGTHVEDHTCPVSAEGEPWAGHGTAMKPSHEPVVLARKPLAGTVASNVIQFGTGALNISACRVESAPPFRYTAKAGSDERPRVNGVSHPTTKPLGLMQFLVRLVTPPGGTVLEPFAGSGTTVEACILEGFRCIAIEREPDYLPLILQRVHRRRDPVAAVRGAGGDGGLFDLLDVDPEGKSAEPRPGKPSTGMHGRRAGIMGEPIMRHRETTAASTEGRWPPNVVMDRAAADILDQQSGELSGDSPNRSPRRNTAEAHNRTVSMGQTNADWTTTGHADSGGASRFFPVFDDDPEDGAA